MLGEIVLDMYWLKNEMARKIKEYKVIEAEDHSDLVAEPQYELFFNNGENERQETGTLRVLSLFSGCSGLDIAFFL